MSKPFYAFFFKVLCQPCNTPCLCPVSVPQCPAGVPLVLDGCLCCQVCARQRGEPCTEMLPCDRQKGLHCDFSTSFPGDPGECVGEQKTHSGGFMEQICMSEQPRPWMFRVCAAKREQVRGGSDVPGSWNVLTSISMAPVDTFLKWLSCEDNRSQ